MALDPAPIAARLKDMFQANTAITDSEAAIEAAAMGIALEIVGGLMSGQIPAGFLVGNYITPLISAPSVVATTNVASGRTIYIPFQVPLNCVIDRLEMNYTSISATSLRVGIYTSEGGIPAEKIYGSSPGTLSGTVVTFMTGDVSLAAGLYFFAFEIDAGTFVGVRSVRDGVPYLPVYSPAQGGSVTVFQALAKNSSFANFPDTISPGDIYPWQLTLCPLFWAKIKSIP